MTGRESKVALDLKLHNYRKDLKIALTFLEVHLIKARLYQKQQMLCIFNPRFHLTHNPSPGPLKITSQSALLELVFVSPWGQLAHEWCPPTPQQKNTFPYMQTEIMKIHTTLQYHKDEAGQALSGERAAVRQIVIVLINHLNFLWGYIRLRLLAIVSSKLFLRSSGARRGDAEVWNVFDVHSLSAPPQPTSVYAPEQHGQLSNSLWVTFKTKSY